MAPPPTANWSTRTHALVYTIMAKVEDLPGYVEGETPVVFR